MQSGADSRCILPVDTQKKMGFVHKEGGGAVDPM